MRREEANIELQIEELILHDLPYDQRQRVAAAIEQALTRLLVERGMPPGFTADKPPIEAGIVTVNANLTAESVGEQVAASIYGQLAAGAGISSAVSSQVKG